MDYLIERITVSGCKLSIKANEEFTQKYLKENFFVEYQDSSILDVDEAVLIVPFIFNVAPIVWLSGNIYRLKVCDRNTYEALLNVRNEMNTQYPMLKWTGGFEVDTIVDVNIDEKKSAELEKVAILFSGGLDSISSSMRHRDKKQLLLAVHGADVALDNKDGWKQVQKTNESYADEFGCDTAYIKANVVDFINVDALLSPKKGVFNWWGCVQHGMGLFGVAVPVIVNKGIPTLLIGSSFTEKFNKPWGSSPGIDNHLKLGKYSFVHDAFEWSRQDKLAFLVDSLRKSGDKPKIRVCHARPDFGDGNNCGRCEKCLRTMCGLAVEGADLKAWGFKADVKIMAKRIRNAVEKFDLKFGDVPCFFWKDMQAKAVVNSKPLIAADMEFCRWFLDFDFDEYLKNYQSKPAVKPTVMKIYVISPLKSFVKSNKLAKKVILYLCAKVF